MYEVNTTQQKLELRAESLLVSPVTKNYVRIVTLRQSHSAIRLSGNTQPEASSNGFSSVAMV